MVLFQNGKLEIWAGQRGKLMMVVFNHKLAQQVNSVLEHYPKGTKFVKGEEPVFPFSRAQIQSIADRSSILRKILVQIGLA